MKTNTEIADNKSKLSMSINPTRYKNKYSNVKKVFIVYSNRKTTTLCEVDVTKISDGKTKYIPEEFKLVQSIRLEFKEAPYKLDIFDEPKSENHFYLDENKQVWSSSFFCFINKDEAIEKLNHKHELKTQSSV